MKKNKTLRVGVLLLALTLITSCFVGSTFARYVKAGNAYDEARVAKFGVTIKGGGNAFGTSYDEQEITDGDGGTKTVYSVLSSNSDDVIAPGTSGPFSSAVIGGDPEVAVEITKVTTLTLSGDWKVKKLDENGNLTTTEIFYCPIIITIGEETVCGLDFDNQTAFEKAVEDAAKVEAVKIYPDNNVTNPFSGINSTISWEWKIEDQTGTVVSQDNRYDTQLGDYAATAGASDEFLTMQIREDITVTQID